MRFGLTPDLFLWPFTSCPAPTGHLLLPRRHKIAILCILFVNAATFLAISAIFLAASTQNRPPVHSVCQRGKLRKAPLSRHARPRPGISSCRKEGNSLRGDSGRFAPSGPSHNLLRPRSAGTCILRAPPPALVRGWTSPPEGVSPFPARGQDRNHGFLVLTECCSTWRRPDFRDFGLPGVLRAALRTLFLPHSLFICIKFEEMMQKKKIMMHGK